MLKLGRKVGQRTRIECPNGELIWVTQCDGYCKVESKLFGDMVADHDGSAWIDIGHDTIEVQYNPWMEKLEGKKIAIDAPDDYIILREELLNEQDRYDNTQRVDAWKRLYFWC